MKNLEIVIRGPVKSGKTALALAIRELLEEQHRIDTDISGAVDEVPNVLMKKNDAKVSIIRSIIGKVTIKTENTKRD